MFDSDLWSEIINALKKNRMRSIMTAFGVFWGIFMLILMSGAGRGLEEGVLKSVKGFATNSAFLWSSRTSEPYAGFKRGRYWEFNNDDIVYLKQNLTGVEYMSPRLFGSSGTNTVRGERSGSFSTYGDYPEYFKIDTWTVTEGRLLNDIDIRENRKVCVIGERVKEVLFAPDENPLGGYIRINGVYFQVVGVIHPESSVNFNGNAKEESIIMPFSTMQRAYNYGPIVHFLSVTALRGYSVGELEEQIKTILKERHKISPTDAQAIVSFNIEKEFQQFEALFMGIRILTWIVGIGTLLAGIIGVSNIMLVIIRERTQEIGIQRAIGATPGVIIRHIVAESIFLTVLAGFIGLSLGVGLLELANMVLEQAGDEVFFDNLQVDISLALIALSILIIAGIFAGLIPAKRAIRIKPIDALRDE